MVNMNSNSPEGANYCAVLFSSKSRCWKIGDFGLSSKATSRHLVMTQYSRGTPSYRAPELLRDSDSTYNNKVDIWALGCIVYELITRERAFSGDWAVSEYALSGTFPPIIKRQLSVLPTIEEQVIAMLSIEAWERPTAE